MRAWYLPMWVNSALPLTSPIAYSHSWPGTRMWASTLIVLPGSRPTRLDADVLRRRLAAERDEHHVADRRCRRRSSCTVTVPSPACSTSLGLLRRCGCRRRSSRSASVSWTQANSSSLRDQPPRALDQRDLAAERLEGLRHLDADDAAAEDDQPLRDLLGDRRLAVGPRAVDRVQARRSAASSAASPVARKTARLASISSSPTVTRRSPESRPWPRISVDPAVLEPRQLRVVVEVVDDLVAPREHRRDVELAGHRLGRAGDPLDLGQRLVGPQQRLRRHARPERALAADQPVLDDRDLQPVLGEPPRRHLARRSGADHHDIESSAWTGPYPPLHWSEQQPRGRQASTWSVRGVGCESRYRRPRKTPAHNKCGNTRTRSRRMTATSFQLVA